VTPVEFRVDFWHQKARVPGLSYGVVCLILRLAVLVEHRLVTDTDRRTQGHSINRASIASRGENWIDYNFLYVCWFVWENRQGITGACVGFAAWKRGRRMF